MEKFKTITKCRSCGEDTLTGAPSGNPFYQGQLRDILYLGEQAIVNKFRDLPLSKKPVDKFPLTLTFCSNQACNLAQIRETIDPVVMFADYSYFSSQSKTMLDSVKDCVERIIKKKDLSKNSFVVEIASNDGYLLKNYVAAGIPCLGIDPAKNIVAQANAAGIPSVAEFFGLEYARKMKAEGKLADVVHANNVIAHVQDVNGFVAGVAEILKPDGVFIIEAPSFVNLIKDCSFDTIYHEHVSYFTLTSMQALLMRHGLIAVDVEQLPLHGGSNRVYAMRRDKYAHTISGATLELLSYEYNPGQMHNWQTYVNFEGKVNRLSTEVLRTLLKLKATGKRVAAYGAAAKGHVLLSYLGLDEDVIEFVVDSTPAKQGKYMPGVDIPVLPPSALLERQPDYTLLLAWNFKNEIIAKESEYINRGGKFIIPVPKVEIISKE